MSETAFVDQNAAVENVKSKLGNKRMPKQKKIRKKSFKTEEGQYFTSCFISAPLYNSNFIINSIPLLKLKIVTEIEGKFNMKIVSRFDALSDLEFFFFQDVVNDKWKLLKTGYRDSCSQTGDGGHREMNDGKHLGTNVGENSWKENKSGYVIEEIHRKIRKLCREAWLNESYSELEVEDSSALKVPGWCTKELKT